MESIMKTRWKAIKFILIPLAVGGVAAFWGRNGMKEFSMVNQPPLTPPMWVFPIAWTILYIMMGIASYLISESDSKDSTEAMILYWLQLAVNFFWTPLFFVAGWYLLSFFWLILLWVLVFACVKKFVKIDKRAAYLMIPYLLWLTFAAYLNFGVYLLN